MENFWEVFSECLPTAREGATGTGIQELIQKNLFKPPVVSKPMSSSVSWRF